MINIKDLPKLYEERMEAILNEIEEVMDEEIIDSYFKGYRFFAISINGICDKYGIRTLTYDQMRPLIKKI